MNNFIISTESNADLSDDFIRENEICVIPHYYSVEGETFGDGVELPIKEFYNALRGQKKAATMASNPAVILDKFRSLAAAGKDILHISFSSALSGGYSNIVVGAGEVMEEFPDCKIIVIDTLSASIGEMLMILKALKLKNDGMTIEDVASAIEDMVSHICVLFTVDDLFHLYRGGRLSKSAAALGTVINIKPILHINDEGRLVPIGKARGRRKSVSALVECMRERIGRYESNDKQPVIGIMHGDCEDDALYLKKLIVENFGFTNFIIRQIAPSIGVHSGPGALGLIFLGEHR